jgi:hypothetical protein
MCDIETAKKKNQISVYNHPKSENFSCSTGKKYKTYNKNSKGSYQQSNNSTNYATFDSNTTPCFCVDTSNGHLPSCENFHIKHNITDNYTIKESILSNNTYIKTYNCPVCDEQALYECNCKYEDSACSNKHHWYYYKGKKIIGKIKH